MIKNSYTLDISIVVAVFSCYLSHNSWKDASFEVILCNASFHHYPNPKVALREMNRLLKPEGTLIIGDPTAPPIIRELTNVC